MSWQAIKAGNSVASQERARSLGVDVMFEVNQLSPETRKAGAAEVSNMNFSRFDGPSASTPLPVSPDVARKCAAQIMEFRTATMKTS